MNIKAILKKRFAMIILTILIIMVSRAKADFIFGTPENLGPTVNSSSGEGAPSISADGLELYFASLRGGNADLWVTRRATTDDEWTEPVSLGPTVNSSAWDGELYISSDGLELYFGSNRSGGSGGFDLWITKRAAVSEPWEEPVNLGRTINTSSDDADICISADGLSLYIESYRSGGQGLNDLWVSKRATISDQWTEPVNLGSAINTSMSDGAPNISADGLVLFFSDHSNPRPGGNGGTDIWMSRRATTSDPWGEPVNLGPKVNGRANDQGPSISANGSTLYFFSTRSGGSGDFDLWQVSIEPVCDFNNDNKVDLADMYIMVDNWGRNYPLCDIGPTPLGDGVVDILDMTVLVEHLYCFSAHWKLDEAEGNIACDNIGGYDGILNGNPFWQPENGVIGGSLLLDGMDDYIETPFILDPSEGSLSVFAWVYSWTQGQVIISQSNTTGSRGTIPGSTWLATNPSEGTLMTGFSEENFGALVSDSVITDFQWHHVGLVYDMDIFHRLLYVDGLLVAEDTTVVSGMPSDGGLYIGASEELDAGNFFSGMIDDIRIYNQALSAEDIAALAD